MDEISVKGEKYLKASILAKNFGYTADYIGQLCRSEQVKAQLVGRSWYVNEDSLRQYRQGRYRSTSTKSKETLRQMAAAQARHDSLPSSYRHSSRYEPDQGELLPLLEKKADNTPSSGVSEKDRTEESPIRITADDQKPTEIPVTPVTIKKVAPVRRTIPAYAAPRPAAATVAPRPIKSPIRHRRRQTGMVALFAAIMLVEGALVFGMLGLEKRMVVSSEAAMVLYAFDARVIQEVFVRP